MLDLMNTLLSDLTPEERAQMIRCVAEADERGDHWRRDQRRPVRGSRLPSARLSAEELDRIAAQPWRGV